MILINDKQLHDLACDLGYQYSFYNDQPYSEFVQTELNILLIPTPYNRSVAAVYQLIINNDVYDYRAFTPQEETIFRLKYSAYL